MELPLFRTVVKIPESQKKISYSFKLMFIGSCFTEEIGKKLTDNLFDVDVNPFGVIYNPISVFNGLKILLDKRMFTESDLERRGSVWFSWYHHSRFSFPDKQQTLDAINSRIEQSSEFLRQADFLFITFGTAWVYVLNRTGQVVSNCHKLPDRIFTRRLLDVDEIVSSYEQLLPALWDVNPGLKIVFTVSPVRHWKDGAVGNQVSKSVLILAIHRLLERFEHLEYFPSYEIVMDELRDYRFYADDMIHIGSQGVDYIWFRFGQTYFSPDLDKTIKEVEKLIKAREHRPFNPDTEEYKQFVNTMIERIMILRKNQPHIKVDGLLDYFLNEKKKFSQNDETI